MPLIGELFSNFGISTAANAILATDATWTLSPGDGSKFPSPGAGQYFRVLAGTVNGTHEIAFCTARSGDVLTVARGQEGTTAQAWNVGTSIQASVTAGSMQGIYTRIQANPINARDYGVQGTGGDDTTAMLSAIASLPPGGGSIYIPAGTSIISNNLALPSNSSVFGDGPATVLQFPGTPGAQISVPTYNIFYINGVSNVEIGHLTLNGNRTGINVPPSTYYYDRVMPIYITGNADNVNIHDCYIHHTAMSGIMANTATNLRIHDNRLFNGGDNLIYIRTLNVSPYGNCKYVTINGNICSNGDYSGIQVLATNYFSITGNTCYSNGPTAGQGDGIGSEGGQHGTITGNTCYNNACQGINIRGTTEVGAQQGSLDIVAAGNNVYSNGSSNGGDTGGIGISDASNILIADNIISNNNYGVNITDVFAVGLSNIVLRGNVIRNSSNYGIRLSTTSVTDYLFEQNVVTDGASDAIWVNQRCTIRGGLVARATVASKNGIYLAGTSSGSVVDGVSVQNMSDSGIQVNGTAVANVLVKNCAFDNISGTFSMGRALQEATSQGPTFFENNTVRNITFQPYNFSNASSRAKNNHIEFSGWYDTNTGSASIAAAATSVSVNHNMPVAPLFVDVAPTSDTQGARWWVTVSSTQITITLNTAAVTNPITFNWRAYTWNG